MTYLNVEDFQKGHMCALSLGSDNVMRYLCKVVETLLDVTSEMVKALRKVQLH